jgi:hypothetical protein
MDAVKGRSVVAERAQALEPAGVGSLAAERGDVERRRSERQIERRSGQSVRTSTPGKRASLANARRGSTTVTS